MSRDDVRLLKRQELESRILTCFRLGDKTQEAVGKRLGVHRNTVYGALRRNPVLASECERLRREVSTEPAPVDLEHPPPVGDYPAFPEWRSRHMAYWDSSTKKVVRAQNNWYQQDAIENIERHNRLLMFLPPGHVKALDRETLLPTPTGWTSIGSVRVGDRLFDEAGAECRVTAKSEVFTDQDCYELEFSTGARIVAGGDHRWFVRARKPQGFEGVLTTEEMYRTQETHDRPNYRVPVTEPLDAPGADLPVSPYVLGYWLGDGSSAGAILHVGEQDAAHVRTELDAEGFSFEQRWHRTAWRFAFNDAPKWSRRGAHSRLRALGVLGDKHIPTQYLRASYHQRLCLLQGLMDSDGTVGSRGQALFNNTNGALALDVAHLVRTLGIKAKFYEGRAMLDGLDMGPSYAVSFYPDADIPVFRLERKQAKLVPAKDARRGWNVVVRIRRVPTRPTQCISVDSPSRLFLAGEHMVPTHNTTTFSIEYPAYQIMGDRNFRATILQKNEDEAKKVVEAVQERLASSDYYAWMNERLAEQMSEPVVDPIKAYGGALGFKPATYGTGATWGKSAFKVAGRFSGEKEPSFQAKGVGSAFMGNRADLIILDDVMDPKRDRTPKAVDDLFTWLKEVVLGRLLDHQKLIVLGNRIGPNDLYARLMEEYPDWPVIKYPAILPCAECEPDWCQDHRAPERVLCPELWTWDGLLRKKAEVKDKWWSMWMMEDGDSESAPFNPASLEAAKNPTRALGNTPDWVDSIFLGCDPAITNYCAITVWGLSTRDGRRALIDVFNERGLRTLGNVKKAILQHVQRYGVRVAAVELANIQGDIPNDEEFRKELAALGCRLETYKTRTETGAQAVSDEFDITSVADLFDGGLVDLPYADERTQAKVDAYVAQLIEWRPGIKYLVRDMVMATLFAESQARLAYQRRRSRPEGTRASRAPRWARDGEGGWPWSKPRQRQVV